MFTIFTMLKVGGGWLPPPLQSAWPLDTRFFFGRLLLGQSGENRIWS